MTHTVTTNLFSNSRLLPTSLRRKSRRLGSSLRRDFILPRSTGPASRSEFLLLAAFLGMVPSPRRVRTVAPCFTTPNMNQLGSPKRNLHKVVKDVNETGRAVSGQVAFTRTKAREKGRKRRLSRACLSLRTCCWFRLFPESERKLSRLVNGENADGHALIVGQHSRGLPDQAHLLEGISAEWRLPDRTDAAERKLHLDSHFVRVEGIYHPNVKGPAVGR